MLLSIKDNNPSNSSTLERGMNELRDPLISVLVPVYNAENYLKELMEQVRQQTLANWEMIIVNDGSTDKSGEICEQLASRDARIRVIHQSNQGVSATRNKLLQKARGAYLAFIDADDRFDKHFLEKLVYQIQTADADLVVSGYNEIKEVKGETVQQLEKLFYPSDYLDVIDMSECIMSFINSGLFNPLWNKLYKRQIVEEYRITFPEQLTTGEDFIFNLEYFKHIQKVSFINETLYDYIRRQNNSITYQYVEKMYEKGLEIHNQLEQFLKQMNYDTKQNELILMENHLGGVFSAWLNLYHEDCKLKYKDKRKEIKAIINRQYVQSCAKEVHSANKIMKLTKILIKMKSQTLVSSFFSCIFILRKLGDVID